MMHTTTPWEIVEGHAWGIEIAGADATESICVVSGDDSVSKANADFIVRAVNSHDGLVEALKAMVEDYDRRRAHAPRLVQLARAALKQAESE